MQAIEELLAKSLSEWKKYIYLHRSTTQVSYTQAFVIGDGRAYEEKAIETITAKLNEPYFFFSVVPNAIFNNIVIQYSGMINHGRNTKFHYRMLTKWNSLATNYETRYGYNLL